MRHTVLAREIALVGAGRAAALALEFGFLVGGFIVLGLFGGRWLDARLDSAPAFLLAGLLLGMVGSVYVFYVIMRLLQRRKD